MSSILLWVLKELFALADQVRDNGFLGLKLVQRLLLPLNQLLYVFNTAGSNITSGAEHDAIQKLNVRFQFITIGIAFPVEINFNCCLGDSGDEVLVLLNEGLQL